MKKTKERTQPSVSKSPEDLETLASQQGVTPVTYFDSLLGDFWPAEESADEFMATVRAWHREGTT